MSEVLRLENITRRYREGEGQLEVFSGLSLQLHPGERSEERRVGKECW